jgi:hypothetical protein
MQIEMWPITRPIPYARNARKITQENIDVLAGLIKEYGFRVPLIVDEEDVIIAGHTRLAAAQKLGMVEIPVHVATGLTKAQKKGLRIADNRVQQNTAWNFELLSLELAELRDQFGYDLSLTAFENHEIAPLLASEWSPAEDEPSEPSSDKHEKPETNIRTIQVTVEQYEVIGRAVIALRSDEGDHTISEGRACELWAADYLAGSAHNLEEEPQESPEDAG